MCLSKSSSTQRVNQYLFCVTRVAAHSCRAQPHRVLDCDCKCSNMYNYACGFWVIP